MVFREQIITYDVDTRILPPLQTNLNDITLVTIYKPNVRNKKMVEDMFPSRNKRRKKGLDLPSNL